MSLLDFLRSVPVRSLTPPQTLRPVIITPQVKTQVATAIRRLQFADRAYGLNLFNRTPTYLQDITHDFEQALAHDDLQAVRLELLDCSNVVCGSFAITFNGPGPGTAPRHDSGSVELPVLDRKNFAGRRLIVTGIDKAHYRSVLRLKWSAAQSYRRAPGDTFGSEFTARSSNGLTKGEFFAAQSSRHQLEVTNCTPGGPYAFARDLTMGGRDGIFILKTHAPGITITIGTRLTALVIMTPKGLQARAVQVA